MKILIANDDGINATGIRTLAERLSRDDTNEVYVVAPDRERSATGHSLTLHKPLRVEEVHLPGFGNVKKAWQTTGTPSDCVKIAVTELLPVTPDIVISGINHGPNLGSEILYSGTVAAAMEGAFLNLRSMAVSLYWGENRLFETAAECVARLLALVPRLHLSERSLLNVNVPNLPFDELEGISITQAGVRVYEDRFEKRTDPRGRVYYWLSGQAVDQGEADNSDVVAVLSKRVSITPVAFNMTDRATVERLQELEDLSVALGGKSADNIREAARNKKS